MWICNVSWSISRRREGLGTGMRPGCVGRLWLNDLWPSKAFSVKKKARFLGNVSGSLLWRNYSLSRWVTGESPFVCRKKGRNFLQRCVASPPAPAVPLSDSLDFHWVCRFFLRKSSKLHWNPWMVSRPGTSSNHSLEMELDHGALRGL